MPTCQRPWTLTAHASQLLDIVVDELVVGQMLVVAAHAAHEDAGLLFGRKPSIVNPASMAKAGRRRRIGRGLDTRIASAESPCSSTSRSMARSAGNSTVPAIAEPSARTYRAWPGRMCRRAPTASCNSTQRDHTLDVGRRRRRHLGHQPESASETTPGDQRLADTQDDAAVHQVDGLGEGVREPWNPAAEFTTVKPPMCHLVELNVARSPLISRRG